MIGKVLLLTAFLASSVFALGSLREKVDGGYKPCDPSVTQWSGYFDINRTPENPLTDKHYFYWAFGPRSGKVDAPVLLWLTGGPGCSSSLATLVENGPCHINETTGDLYSNPYSWNNDAYVIYIDQPAGVGFSYGEIFGYDSNETQVSQDVYWFLQAFFAAHPTLQTNDFFVVGESYGGHFAPASAYAIYNGNKNHEGSIHINLVGLAVGNGLTDAYLQYPSYPELAYGWCEHQTGSPCVTKETYESMKSQVPGCQAAIRENCFGDGSSCSNAAAYCNGLIEAYEQTGKNVYDVRKMCNGPLCYDFSKVISFMNRQEVQTSLGVNQTVQWQPCNYQVNGMFQNDWFMTFNYTVPPLLESGVRVLIYAGDEDFICNWIGNKNWTTALQWTQQSAFDAAADKPVMMNNEQVALVRSVGTTTTPILFSFFQVHGAGHMVPMDQPATANYMINQFMSNKKFA